MNVNPETVTAYLTERGIVPDTAKTSVEPLGGGVSNNVLRVDWDDDAVIVKQPLPNLEVQDDWPADIDRIHNEAAAARVYREVVSAFDINGVTVPEVRLEDHDDHVIAIEAAPREVRTWKTELLDGDIDSSIAVKAADFLASAHEFVAADTSLESVFDNYLPFEQLRLEPYHETVAARHQDVASQVHAEVNRIRGTRSTLVHGDFSPKNILVDRTKTEPLLWILDFEVAHWGDPAFDLAFILNHLFIKSVYAPTHRDEYLSAAESLWSHYLKRSEVEPSFESNVVTEIGILMLARVDGKSPVEYVQSDVTKAQLRSLAKHALDSDMRSLDTFIAEVRSESDKT